MAEYQSHPPLTLVGHVVVRCLDDAVRFMTGYRQARQSFMRESVLHRLKGAADQIGERDAANAFRERVEMADLIESD